MLTATDEGFGHDLRHRHRLNRLPIDWLRNSTNVSNVMPVRSFGADELVSQL